MSKINQKVYRILKRNGINNQLERATTFKNEREYGYDFKLKDGRKGKIFLQEGAQVIL